MDPRELYQDIILDHGRRPRNFRKIEQPSHFAHGHNPLCGDRVTVFVSLDGDRIKDVSFDGRGCAISTASASLMTEILKGKTLAEAEALFARFRASVTGEGDESAPPASRTRWIGSRRWRASRAIPRASNVRRSPGMPSRRR